ncbi:BTB domain-containing protein [Trichonephila clavata]|uniref:BTB domain-containing protein n=1 Tax=Trichonephila clavata TaxID=2740835 RepID=A0A8X6LW97_TRICU|nr:BTB domain-containing protein [Trichonephila clavata]
MDSSSIDTGKRNEITESTLQNDLLEMYEKKVNTDVNICVENSFVCFTAHKLILATRSPVFADMFWNDPESQPETIKIEGASAQVMTLLLWYIYTDELRTNSFDELIELAKVGQRYEIGGLIRACKCRIARHPINRNNVFTLMEALRYFKLYFCFKRCLKFIRSVSPTDLFKRKEFLEISHDTLLQILKHRDTSNESDIYVMEAVIHWLQHRNKRDRSLLTEFNIFSLSCDEFLDLVGKFPSFFTSREITQILCNIIRPGLMKLPPWCKKDSVSDNNKTFRKILDENSLSEDFFRRALLSTSLEIKTDCQRAFLKSYFYEEDGFDVSVTFEIKLSRHFPFFPIW